MSLHERDNGIVCILEKGNPGTAQGHLKLGTQITMSTSEFQIKGRGPADIAKSHQTRPHHPTPFLN